MHVLYKGHATLQLANVYFDSNLVNRVGFAALHMVHSRGFFHEHKDEPIPKPDPLCFFFRCPPGLVTRPL